MLAEAVHRAPSVHYKQPWSLRVHGRTAILRMRSTPDLVQQDPDGRDRRISCGSAVADLVIAMRGLGWATDVRWQVDDEHTGGEATVIGSHRSPATAIDRDRQRAIGRQVSFRRPFADQPITDRPIPHLARTAVVCASTTQATWVDGPAEKHALARLLVCAAADQTDKSYQRELGAWIAPISDERLLSDDQKISGKGKIEDSLSDRGLPAVGLATSGTHRLDQDRIARWLAPGSVLVFSTMADGARDHLLAGEAAGPARRGRRAGLLGGRPVGPGRVGDDPAVAAFRGAFRVARRTRSRRGAAAVDAGRLPGGDPGAEPGPLAIAGLVRGLTIHCGHKPWPRTTGRCRAWRSRPRCERPADGKCGPLIDMPVMLCCD